jgi:hypothetical protein
MRYKTFYVFLLIVILLGVISWSINNLFLNNEIIFFQTYGYQLSISSIESIIGFFRRWQWLSYVSLLLLVLFRVFYTSVFLYIGIFFTELKVEFGKLFKIALFADFVYVLSAFSKLVILIFFKEVNTLEDLQFQPLSTMELLNAKSIDPLFVYPLSLINVFELGYFLVLAWLLVNVINEANEERPVGFGKSLKLVTASYGSGLLLWVVFVMFITLNLS